MRAFQIFAAMTPEHAEAVFEQVAKDSPVVFSQAVAAASAALKSRPSYLRKQPFAKRCAAVRRALARVAANPVSEEVLAVYFLESRKALLVEWLEIAGVAHEDGTLSEDAPAQPADDSLRKAVDGFRSAADDPDRELLLQAFAAQPAIDWPLLDDLISSRLS